MTRMQSALNVAAAALKRAKPYMPAEEYTLMCEHQAAAFARSGAGTAFDYTAFYNAAGLFDPPLPAAQFDRATVEAAAQVAEQWADDSVPRRIRALSEGFHPMNVARNDRGLFRLTVVNATGAAFSRLHNSWRKVRPLWEAATRDDIILAVLVELDEDTKAFVTVRECYVDRRFEGHIRWNAETTP